MPRYYASGEYELGLTRSQLKRAAKTVQLKYMEEWFARNFEDSAQRTPYESAEGGYQYIWGGPYDAGEELSDEFGDIIREDRIQQVIDRVEADGILDWAPTMSRVSERDGGIDRPSGIHPDIAEVVADLEAGAVPKFGPYERGLRPAVVQRLIELEATIADLQEAGIGHNRPPGAIDDAELSERAASEIREAASVIRLELAKSQPDALLVAKKIQLLHNAGRWLWGKS